MFVKKFNNGNINVKFDFDIDRRPSKTSRLTWVEGFAVMLCRSGELDFTTDGELHREGLYLYNYNTDGEYLINHRMAKDFFEGRTVCLEKMKNEGRVKVDE